MFIKRATFLLMCSYMKTFVNNNNNEQLSVRLSIAKIVVGHLRY